MIPLVKELDVDEINTALIAIRKLLNNVGITETNITNIVGKDYDAKIQELEGKIAADDTYSTTEVKTNKKWIDGKPIYRKVVTGLNITVTGSAWYTLYTDANIEELVNGCVFLLAHNGTFTTLYRESISLDKSNHTIQSHFDTYFQSKIFQVEIEYTKTTD